jgi:hypothetical protein
MAKHRIGFDSFSPQKFQSGFDRDCRSLSVRLECFNNFPACADGRRLLAIHRPPFWGDGVEARLVLAFVNNQFTDCAPEAVRQLTEALAKD